MSVFQTEGCGFESRLPLIADFPPYLLYNLGMLIGEQFFKDTTDEFSKGGGFPSSAVSNTDRLSMIEQIFNEVLGRKPSSRELAYYKYGVLKEDAIRIKLLKSDEHKEIIKNALELPGIANELKNTKVSERKLQQKLEDVNNEIAQSQKLLNESNLLIKELRETKTNPYDFPTQSARYEEGFDLYEIDKRDLIKRKDKTFKESLLELINLLFK